MAVVVGFARRFPFTAFVIVVIVAVYAVEIAQSRSSFWVTGQGDLPDIALWGVVWRPAIADGEWWRLITAGFLHAGLLHILMNVYALVIIGAAAESRFGPWFTAFVFLAAVVGGNVAAFAFQTDAASLGASGGVMGLAGAVVVGAFASGEGLARSQWVLSAIVITLAFGFINPGISNAAHIGGLLVGGLVALPVGLFGRRRMSRAAVGRAAMNPRQAEFQRRIDEAMRKAAEERARRQ